MLGRKLFLLLFLMLLIVLYFWGHNSGQQALILAAGLQTVVRALVDLLAVLALVTVSGGIGRRTLERIAISGLSRAEMIAFASGIGLGIIALLALLAGLAGFFQPTLWVGVLLLGVLTFAHIRLWLRDLRGVILSATTTPDSWSRFVVIYSSVLVGMALLLALAPPFRWDAITYHLTAPAQYVRDGAVLASPDNHFFGFPQAMEILYGLLMMITGADRAPAVLHLVMGLLGLLATAGIVQRYSSRATAAAAILIPLTSYNIWLLFGWAYVDLAMMLYGALALIAFVEWSQSRAVNWLLLAGLLSGLALGVKYLAAAPILAVSAGIFFAEPRAALRNLLLYGTVTALFFLPWMAKGLLLYGNPLYPYVFGGLNWDTLRSANFSAAGSGFLAQGLLFQLQIPLLPFAATLFGIDGVSPYMFTTGVWLLTLPFALPVVFRWLPDRSKTLARALLVPGVVLLLFWMLLAATSGIGAQPRLLLAGVPLAAILGALTLEAISRMPRRPLDLAFLLRAMLIFTIVFGSFDLLHYFAGSRALELHSGVIRQDDYLRRNLGIHYDALRHLQELPAESTVLFLWESKSYYCPAQIRCIPDVLFDHWARPLMQGASVADLAQTWREQGISHFLLQDSLRVGDRFGYTFWLQEHTFARQQNDLFPEFVAQYLQPLWTDEIGYTLYAWR